ncbi:GNAT family N-acetyltransferase [Paracoccus sp. S-4012]|nr:GNAT family N-acetyltransferase [Paracoccus sp. S-4012]MRX50972.1 GNAT family N-acetyltransferase [Paracoccus sp. S-4012]
MRDYVDGLGLDLSFQDAEAELAALPGAYAPPRGALLLARGAGERALGVIALRPLPAEGECECKRLYVRPEARGLSLGTRLGEAILARARGLGYRRMLLDTLDTMTPALRVYRGLGFREIPAYYPNPLPGVVYLGRDLG